MVKNKITTKDYGSAYLNTLRRCTHPQKQKIIIARKIENTIQHTRSVRNQKVAQGEPKTHNSQTITPPQSINIKITSNSTDAGLRGSRRLLLPQTVSSNIAHQLSSVLV